jgi:hypothetical protein
VFVSSVASCVHPVENSLCYRDIGFIELLVLVTTFAAGFQDVLEVDVPPEALVLDLCLGGVPDTHRKDFVLQL